MYIFSSFSTFSSFLQEFMPNEIFYYIADKTNNYASTVINSIPSEAK